MSQHDYNIANQTFPATRTDLNNALGAVATNNSGNSAPSTTYANQWWFDLDDNKLYMRNKDNDAWVEILTIGATSDKVESIGSGGGLTITTADNTDTLSLISTDADASSGPNLRMYRNSSSPADSDVLGVMEYEGRNDNSQDVRYVQLTSQADDVSDGSEDGSYYITTSVAGTLRNRINVIPTEVVVNEEGRDLDFRVESDGNANMLFVNAGAEAVCVGTSSGTGLLNVVAADGVKDADYVVKIENQEATGGRSFGLNLAAGSSGSDIALNVNDHDSANNLMRLFGNGTTAFPVTTAFGIGTDSPGATFHVDNSSGGVIRVSRNSASTSNYIAIESDGTNGTVKAIQELIISAGGGEVARFTSGGLAIGGTGAANTLDDYEEGTFSPSLSGASGAPSGVNYSIRTGSYTKIGRLVTCHIYLALSSWSSGPSGDGIITALPFTVRNDNDSYAAANIAYADGFISSDAPQTGYAVINTTKINLQTNQSSDSRDDLRTPVNAGNFSGDETIIITCSYHTDS